MAAILPYRPPTNGTASSSNGLDRKTSLSSFPASRTSSNQSIGNGTGRMPSRAAARRNGSNSSTQSVPTPASNTEPASNFISRSTRKLKPQYPADSTERHVEYILVATFDIDRGPIMEHQYPGAISGDEGMLAELMLPDQAHVRNQDWTIFFLHKDTGDEEAEAQAKRLRRERRKKAKEDAEADNVEGGNPDGVPDEEEEADEEEEEDQEGGEGPPLIYVLNLVNTKQDSSVKRGAVVRAMAICTRHSFLHIYKPLLLLALEEYFKSPYPETLAMLYDAVNAMDLSLLPRLSTLERYILQASDTKDMFIEKFDQMIQQRMASEAGLDNPTSPDSPPKNGIEPPRQGRYALPRDTHEYETRVVYNGIPIPIKIPTAASFETVGDFSCIKLIQAFSAPHTTSPQPFALHPHLTTSGAYTHPIIVLVNAMLTQKRVIFLGHNRPSGEVAEAVLAACTLVSGGVLRGFTRHAFPYTDLSKIDDLLKVPGFVAGVTNPTFANHPEWWDLLCDIPTGRMKISNRIEQAYVTDGFVYFQQQNPAYAPNNSGVGGGAQPVNGNNDPTGDHAFMDDIIRSIASRHGESVIRSKWRDYITKFTRIAAAFEESVYGASALYIGAQEADAGAYGVSGHGYVWPDETSRGRELGANVWRIEGWRNTRSYYSFIQDLAALWGRLPIRKLDLGHQLDRLRQLKLSHDDSGHIFLAMRDAVRTYEEVCQLLTVTPENHAGLFYLSLGLFHPDGAVRWGTVELLERVKEHEAGRHFWSQLGRFAKCAYVRIKREGGGQMVMREEEGVGVQEEWEGRPRTGTGGGGGEGEGKGKGVLGGSGWMERGRGGG